MSTSPRSALAGSGYALGCGGGPIVSWLLIVGALAQGACPDPAPLLDQADKHLTDGAYSEAVDVLLQAREGFSCGTPRSEETLAHYFLTTGAVAYVKDDRNAAVEAFAAASLRKPDLWILAHGQRLRAVYEGAAVGITGEGMLRVEPGPGSGQRTFVDGFPMDLPSKVAAGMHLFQLTERDEVIFGEFVVVPEDGAVTVSLSEVQAAAPPEPLVPPKPEREPVTWSPKQKRNLRFGILGAAGVSGLCAVGAALQNGSMNRAETPDQVTAAYRRQVGFAVTSYSMLGAVGFGIMVHENL